MRALLLQFHVLTVQFLVVEARLFSVGDRCGDVCGLGRPLSKIERGSGIDGTLGHIEGLFEGAFSATAVVDGLGMLLRFGVGYICEGRHLVGEGLVRGAMGETTRGRCKATAGGGMGLLLVLDRGAARNIEVGLGTGCPSAVWVAGCHVVRGGRGLVERGCDVDRGVLDGPLFWLEAAVQGLVALEACVADESGLVLGVRWIQVRDGAGWWFWGRSGCRSRCAVGASVNRVLVRTAEHTRTRTRSGGAARAVLAGMCGVGCAGSGVC